VAAPDFFKIVLWGWIGSKSTNTAAIYWPTVAALNEMVMIVEQLVE
jgi:hypothetical protein